MPAQPARTASRSGALALPYPLAALLTLALAGPPAPAAAHGTGGAEPMGAVARAPEAEPTAEASAPTLEEEIGRELAEAPPAASARAGSSPARSRISLNPDLAFVLDAAAGWFSSEEPLQSGAHDPRRTGFTLQQLELSASSVVDPYFRLDGFLVFSQFGVEIEEIYATTTALPWSLQLRVGQFLTRFGRLNATHPHAWDFVDQPFANSRVFGGEGNRGLGVEASWLSPLPWFLEVIGSVTEAGGEATARSFYGGTDLGVSSLADLQLTLAVKQLVPLGEATSLLIGVSGATGPNSTGHDNRTELGGIDLYLRWRPLALRTLHSATLQSEWIYRRRQIPEDVLQDVNGYAQGTLRWARGHLGAGLRWEYGSPAFDLDGRRTLDPLDPDWTDPRQRVSASLTWWPTEFSRLRFQLGRDAAGWRPEADWSAVVSAEFLIGAHGAHAF